MLLEGSLLPLPQVETRPLSTFPVEAAADEVRSRRKGHRKVLVGLLSAWLQLLGPAPGAMEGKVPGPREAGSLPRLLRDLEVGAVSGILLDSGCKQTQEDPWPPPNWSCLG